MTSIEYFQNIILSYNFEDVDDNKIIQLYLKSNNFSDIHYYENKYKFIDELNSDEKINEKIKNFIQLDEIINYHEIKILN
jgi:hypothetical protein